MRLQELYNRGTKTLIILQINEIMINPFQTNVPRYLSLRPQKSIAHVIGKISYFFTVTHNIEKLRVLLFLKGISADDMRYRLPLLKIISSMTNINTAIMFNLFCKFVFGRLLCTRQAHTVQLLVYCPAEAPLKDSNFSTFANDKIIKNSYPSCSVFFHCDSK